MAEKWLRKGELISVTGIDLRGYIGEGQQEECEHAREVASKFGIQVVCDDEEAQTDQIVMHGPENETCEHGKEVVSKFGVQVVCDEEE